MTISCSDLFQGVSNYRLQVFVTASPRGVFLLSPLLSLCAQPEPWYWVSIPTGSELAFIPSAFPVAVLLDDRCYVFASLRLLRALLGHFGTRLFSSEHSVVLIFRPMRSSGLTPAEVVSVALYYINNNRGSFQVLFMSCEPLASRF